MGLLSKQGDVLESQLQEARKRIADLEAELSRSSTRDALTESLLTLRAFRAQLELDVQRAHRYRRPLSVAIIDIDGFRSINLNHGYGAGDQVLVAVAGVIAQMTRAHDLACRMGGDEFAVLLPETGSHDAHQAVERILIGLEDLSAGPVRGISVSIGVAALDPGQSPEQLFASANKALEQARASGGGRAAIASGGDDGEELAPDIGHGDVVAALASALQERDQYTGEHSESVVGVAGRVGEALALDEEQISKLRTAALLHDIGKVGMPNGDPPQARARSTTRVGHDARAPGDRRADRARDPRPRTSPRSSGTSTSAGTGRATRTGSPARRSRSAPHRSRLRRLPRDDLGPALSGRADAHRGRRGATRNAGTQFDPNVSEALIGYLYGRRQAGITGL